MMGWWILGGLVLYAFVMYAVVYVGTWGDD